MSFESIYYLYLAQELIGQTPPDPANREAKSRSAISRAYYAVFLQARNYLEENTSTMIRHSGEDHKIVRDAFKYHQTDGKWRKIGNNLGTLLEDRTFADYEEDESGMDDLATAAIDKAKLILNLLNQLPVSKKGK